MNPQKRPPIFPFCNCIALKEPGCGSTVSCLPNEVVIRRRVRGREPVSNVLSQLVTYKIPSVLATKGGKKTNVSSCLFHLTPGGERLRRPVNTGATCFEQDTYPNPVEYYPLIPFHLIEQVLRKTEEQPFTRSAPSITTFTLPTRPWTTLKVCATVIRASSWVNRSNLWTTASISLSPNNFFANFSGVH